MKPVIKVEELSKMYRLGQVGTGSIAHDVNRWWHRVRGKEDPYLRIGETNDRTIKGSSEYVWALKDINFEVSPGEVLGIIGRNGAGKSTLLKILSRTTAPTTGSVKIKGRVASLLEVGTGFHPDLSGRDNIFLNGAILGMTRREIQSKFDEIVDFAGVERYIDTPVKRYSSGMYVRLAFAVAAHLEPEILIVDEVLAVGDAEFQKKCLGKMKDVSDRQGRTVLFVSHDLYNVNALCQNAVLLENSQIKLKGKTIDVIEQYKNFQNNEILRTGNGKIKTTNILFRNSNGNDTSIIDCLVDIDIDLEFEALEELEDVSIAICFDKIGGGRVTSLWSSYQNRFFSIKKGKNKARFHVDDIRLIPGNYSISTYFESRGTILERVDNLKKIEVYFNSEYGLIKSPVREQGSYLERFDILFDNK